MIGPSVAVLVVSGDGHERSMKMRTRQFEVVNRTDKSMNAARKSHFLLPRHRPTGSNRKGQEASQDRSPGCTRRVPRRMMGDRVFETLHTLIAPGNRVRLSLTGRSTALIIPSTFIGRIDHRCLPAPLAEQLSWLAFFSKCS